MKYHGLVSHRLSNRTELRLHLRGAHDRLPTMDIRQKVHIGFSGPTMGNAYHLLENILRDQGLNFDMSPIRFNDHRISILNSIFLGSFWMNLCIGLRVLLSERFDVSVLGMSAKKISCSCGKDERISMR